MKPPKVGELMAMGSAPAERRRIQVGERRGHLEVVEEVKRRGGVKVFKCRCTNPKQGGFECGNMTVRDSSYLSRDCTFMACKECVAEYLRGVRLRYGRGAWLSGGDGNGRG